MSVGRLSKKKGLVRRRYDQREKAHSSCYTDNRITCLRGVDGYRQERPCDEGVQANETEYVQDLLSSVEPHDRR